MGSISPVWQSGKVAAGTCSSGTSVLGDGVGVGLGAEVTGLVGATTTIWLATAGRTEMVLTDKAFPVVKPSEVSLAPTDSTSFVSVGLGTGVGSNLKPPKRP